LTNLSDADVIVHSGDFTMYGKDGEVMAFVDWFCDCPIKYKIFVAGNHDCLYDADLSGQDKSCYYLCNSGIYLEGVSFYGIPMFVGDIRTGNAGNNVYAIPQNTDVLISHQPPLGILDFADNQYYGDEDLLRIYYGKCIKSSPSFIFSDMSILPVALKRTIA
jgi:3',5'-cyclic AMP phosphodiesterase CpdA